MVDGLGRLPPPVEPPRRRDGVRKNLVLLATSIEAFQRFVVEMDARLDELD
jgi:hypothetical protein